MATTNITELASEACSAIETSTQHLQPRCTSHGRTAQDVAAELCDALTKVPDAIADAEALLDIATADGLGDELEDCAALIAGALFLGRRLIDSNLDELAELDEWPAQIGEAARQLAAILDLMSERLRDVVTETLEVADDTAA